MKILKNMTPKELLEFHKKELGLASNFCFVCKSFCRITEDNMKYYEKHGFLPCIGYQHISSEFPETAAHCWRPREGYDELGKDGWLRWDDIKKGEVDI